MATKSPTQFHNHWGSFANSGSLPGVGVAQDGLEAGDLAFSVADGATFTCTNPAFPAVWSSGGGGGSGNDSYPDIDQWVTVDKTTGSYTPDGTIQFPENTIAAAIVDAAALSPTATRRVGIKLMPGHYTETGLDLPSYVYVVGESKEACYVTGAFPAQLLVQTNPDCGWYNVTFERTGNDNTVTHAIEIGVDDGLGAGAGVSGIIFEDVNFDFNQTYGIIVQGATAPSEVVFRECRMQADYDPAWFPRPFGLCVTSYSSGLQPHVLEFDQSYVDGDIWPQIGSISLWDTLVNGQVRVTDSAHAVTDTDIHVSHSRIEFYDVDQPDRFGAPEGGIYLHTTGEVFLDESVCLGTFYDDGCMSTTNNALYLVSTDDVPSRLVLANSRFGYNDALGVGFSALYETIGVGFAGVAAYMAATITQCSFDVGVSSKLVNAGQEEFPCGPGQLYNAASDAMTAVANVGIDYLIVKLHADDPCSVSFRWPDSQWVILDLNGFTATGGGSMISETSGSGEPYAIIRNGRMAGGWTLLNASAGTTGNWQVIYRNIDIDGGAKAEIGGSGTSVLAIFDDVRNWIGSGPFCVRLYDSNNPEIHFRHCYLKGSNEAAVIFDNQAFSKFYASRSTFFHGQFGTNLPLRTANTGSQGSATPVLDYCRFNADPSTDAFITLAGESAYNILNATADFLG